MLQELADGGPLDLGAFAGGPGVLVVGLDGLQRAELAVGLAGPGAEWRPRWGGRLMVGHGPASLLR